MGRFLGGVIVGFALMYLPFKAMEYLYNQTVEHRDDIQPRYRFEEQKPNASFSGNLCYNDGTNSWELRFEDIPINSSNKTNKNARENKLMKFSILVPSRDNPLTGETSKYNIGDFSREVILNHQAITNSSNTLKPKINLDALIR